ncbi:hypothetical protein NM688_g3025 [Phlebia brevispora]|uniref:Uncharacterized protein n=1 Tax=Phlebia brevispora TaxID=194682 RepID=A0ACC1T7B2_9APHY|nr:hypothetical protein NM688_g3025 [Phlebia brevispora]
MQLGQLELIVVCDDSRRLQEYRVEQQDARTITCFISSEAGKPFKICTTNLASQPLVGKVKLDGLKVRTFRAVANGVHVADCVYLSQSVKRPFLFSQTLTAHLDNEDDVTPDADLLDRTGSIQIDFFRCELGPELPWFSRGAKDISLRSFSGGNIAHQILLGTQQIVRNKRVSGARATLLDPADLPYARFIFKYQSKGDARRSRVHQHAAYDPRTDILQSHGIIPRPLVVPVTRSPR